MHTFRKKMETGLMIWSRKENSTTKGLIRNYKGVSVARKVIYCFISVSEKLIYHKLGVDLMTLIGHEF